MDYLNTPTETEAQETIEAVRKHKKMLDAIVERARNAGKGFTADIVSDINEARRLYREALNRHVSAIGSEFGLDL